MTQHTTDTPSKLRKQKDYAAINGAISKEEK